MSDIPIDIKRINEILNDTITTIETNREEIFDIVQHARNEYNRIKEQLQKVKEKAEKVIDEVDLLEIGEKSSRARLVSVSKNFKYYDEEDIRNAYEKANELRVLLTLKREEEKSLIEKRADLEFRLKESVKILEKAKNINRQVGVAMECLKGNINDILTTVGDLSKKQLLGIKIIEAQEEERQRLARDIHDGPAQSMASIVIKTELCERLLITDKEKTKEELIELKNIARHNLKDIRKIIYDLRPMALDDLGLIPTLERYTYNFQKETGILVKMKVLGNIKYVEPTFEIAIFRIVQEALNNIQKHSNATNVNIILEGTLEKLNLMVSDDGDGFDLKLYSNDGDVRTGGFGLISMKERAELINGKFEIKSLPGMGTKIYLSTPLVKEENYNE